MATEKKVFVSGCYDLLHGGHIAFLKTAAAYGKLFVGIGSDENIRLLKKNTPYFNQDERIYILNSIKYVEKAFVNSGSGMLDFEPDLKSGNYDIFVVNKDGHTPEKEKLCKKLGIQYEVLERIPEKGLPARSSSSTKQDQRFPYRICLAGGWMDQPWVSKIHPGVVVVAQIYPTIDFNDRSGMATSSRKIATEIWGDKYPAGDPIRNSRILFGAENPPDSEYVSGSQDQIGLLSPGISRLYYDGEYWPSGIDNCTDKDVCEWLSEVIHIVPLEPRPLGYNPLQKKNLAAEFVKKLGAAGELCWQGSIEKNLLKFGEGLTKTFEMWKKILPYTVPEDVAEQVEKYKDFPGAITSGSGGGYIVIASDRPIKDAIKIRVRY